ncbi:unnamed protein product [Polarella glacialis]|uniref:Tocopherol cyclase n=1 Tax=Polarella glacialis TaxID=89957 RepID=A0A813D9H7_POLGL|nr:unnamed protein product [Polarella glacialis]
MAHAAMPTLWTAHGIPAALGFTGTSITDRVRPIDRQSRLRSRALGQTPASDGPRSIGEVAAAHRWYTPIVGLAMLSATLSLAVVDSAVRRLFGRRRLRGERSWKLSEASSGEPPPHSGCHFDGSSRRFFEGWYMRVTAKLSEDEGKVEEDSPSSRASFAFMYWVERGKRPPLLRTLRRLRHGVSGGGFEAAGAQVMGPDGKVLFQAEVGREAADRFLADPNRPVFGFSFRRPETGYRVEERTHRGSLVDDATGETCDWDYSTTACAGYGSGPSGAATAGWLAALPIFEPHWQVIMAHGRSSGHINWRGRRYEFSDAPSYAEKNWGGSFPMKWWWVQCNDWVPASASSSTAQGRFSEVSLTTGGGRRGLLLPGLVEDVGMVAVHAKEAATGEWHFFEFVPWRGPVAWSVQPWRPGLAGSGPAGRWAVTATNRQAGLEVEVLALTDAEGSDLRAPTEESGMDFFCKDAYTASVSLKIWTLTKQGVRGDLLLDVSTPCSGGVEVGGGPWWTAWEHRAEMPRAVAWMMGLPLDAGLQTAKKLLPAKVPGL